MLKQKLRSVSIPPVFWMIVLFIIIFSTGSPYFFQFGNLYNILIQSAPLLIVAVGATMVILTEGTDLSIGGVISMVTVLWMIFLNLGIPMYVAAPMAVASGILSGFINGIVVSRGNLPPFIATLGMASITTSIALVLTKGASAYYYHSLFSLIAGGSVLGIPNSVLIAITVFALSWMLLYHTKFGAHIFGLGGNREALVLAGVQISRSHIGAYTFSGFLAGIAGLLVASRIESGHPTVGVGWEFDAIAAAILGGTSFNEGRGGIGGTVFGVFLITVLRNGLNVVGISAMYQNALIGGAVLSAIVIDVYLRRVAEERIENQVQEGI